MILLLFLFAAAILSAFSNDVQASQVPYCNQIHMIENIPRWWSDGVVVFNFSMDLSISVVDDWNTLLSFSNYVSWSADQNLYYQDKPLRYLTNGESENPYIYCPTINGVCNITIFNAAGGTFQLPIHLDGLQDYSPDTYLYTGFNFDMGLLYTWTLGNFFDPNGMTCEGTSGGTVIRRQYCCTNYIYATVPDTVEAQCINFESNTTFSTADGTVIASFAATYAYTSDGIEYSINPILLPSNFPFYEFFPNMPKGHFQNVSFPMTFIDPYVPFNGRDFQVSAWLSIKNSVWDAEIGGMTIAGRIIGRNGILFKDHQNPYTPADPCSNSMAPIFSGTQANNNFCCTKFQTPSTESTCAEYQSFTKVYNIVDYEGIYFNIKYQFNSTNMILTIQAFGSPRTSNLLVEAYSTDLFSQTCKVSTDSPTNTCVFKLSTTDQYLLQYRTSINPDVMSMTGIYVSGNQIFDPYLTPAKPCQSFYQFDLTDSSQPDSAMTEFCCIAKSGGDWPGALSSTGYPYPFAQRIVRSPRQQKLHDVKKPQEKHVFANTHTSA